MGVGEVKFLGQILPSHQKVTYELQIKRVIERKLVMGIADGKSFGRWPRDLYRPVTLNCGLFTRTDNFNFDKNHFGIVFVLFTIADSSFNNKNMRQNFASVED